MIITHKDENNNKWYLHKTVGKNKRTVYYMSKNKENACSINEEWFRKYTIIQGKNMPMIKKRVK